MRKLLTWVLLLALSCMSIAACAADDDQSITGGILAYLTGGVSVQEWLDTTLANGASTGTDNIIPALIKYDSTLNFEKYADALEAKFESGIRSITTNQRTALFLSVLGRKDCIPASFADDTIGEMGVMSYVYGLHLLNNGFTSEKWTIESLVEKLEELQLDDGGWAVTGNYGDPDVTAMCMQALIASKSESGVFDHVMDRASMFLSNVQNPDGSYSSYGSPACESCAQVIIALNAMNITLDTADLYIKNGHTIMDAMLSFRLDDGSFSHLQGGEANIMAGVQAFSAMVAMDHPGESFYNFTRIIPGTSTDFSLNLPLWKLIALGAILLFALIGTTVSLFRKRAKGKRVLVVLILSCIAAFGVYSINIESTSDYYQEVQRDQPAAGTVSISIRCDTISDMADEKDIPSDGIILDRSAFDFYEGDSAFDVLTYAVRKHGIHMEYTGATDELAYVNGLNHLYEYDYGDLSGWLYSVNGKDMSIGCGSYKVQDGDDIIWKYSLKLGEDVR